MKFPVFVFHELVFRLAEINTAIGRYISYKPNDDTFILTTYSGTLIVPSHFIEMQFKDPELISRTDLLILASNFKTLS